MATLELPVKWQGKTFSIVLPADADVSALKRQLEVETRVQARALAPADADKSATLCLPSSCAAGCLGHAAACVLPSRVPHTKHAEAALTRLLTVCCVRSRSVKSCWASSPLQAAS